MADQTQVNQRSENTPIEPSRSLGGDVGGFAHDLLSLAELQSQLFLAEVREVGQRSVLPSVLLISSLMLGASCFPIALVAFAFGLAQLVSLSMAAAFMIALAVGMLGSLMLLIISWFLGRRRIRFQRSQEEFLRNYQWIKLAFKGNRIAYRNSTNCSKEPKR